MYLILAKIVAQRTGGASGSAQDSAGFVITGTVKNIGGTATLVGTPTIVNTDVDNNSVSATLTVSGSRVQVSVTGATGNNYTWSGIIEVTRMALG